MCVIEGHEFLMDLQGYTDPATGYGGFKAVRVPINPGLPSFPWLSGQSQGWEKYRFRSLSFSYVPIYATTASAGSVFLGIDYDPTDAAPNTLAALSSFESLKSSRMWDSCSLQGQVRKMFDGVQAKRIRCGPTAESRELFDPCSLIVATDGTPVTAAGSYGQIWIKYVIELISPQTSPSPNVPSNVVAYSHAAGQTFTTTVAAPVLFDTALVSGFEHSLAAGIFSMPCGSYIVSGLMKVRDDTTEVLTALVEVLKNGAVLTNPQNSSLYVNNTAATNNMVAFQVYISSTTAFTMRLNLTLTGAAGVLRIPVNGAQIFIQVQ